MFFLQTNLKMQITQQNLFEIIITCTLLFKLKILHYFFFLI